MANQLRAGAIPSGSQTRAQTRRYTLASGFTLQNSCPGIAVGEFVKPVSDGTVIIAETTDVTILGVVASIKYKNADGSYAYGYIPAGYTYTGDADVLNPNAPIIEVWDDPGIEYLIPLHTASATALTNFQLTFNTCDLSATSSASVDTIYKRSLRTAIATAQTGSAQLKILELLRSPSQDYTADNLRAKVMINEGVHAFLQSGAGGV